MRRRCTHLCERLLFFWFQLQLLFCRRASCETSEGGRLLFEFQLLFWRRTATRPHCFFQPTFHCFGALSGPFPFLPFTLDALNFLHLRSTCVGGRGGWGGLRRMLERCVGCRSTWFQLRCSLARQHRRWGFTSLTSQYGRGGWLLTSLA